MSNKVLYLLRHGESYANVTCSFASHKMDLPLTDYGIEQVKQISVVLKNIGFEVIYSSPLLRALQTAQIIGERCNLNPIVDESLREIDVGELDGKSIDEPKVKSIYEEIRTQWDQGKYDITFTGGESLKMVETRLNNFLKHLDNQHNSPILVVGHGLLFSAFIYLFCKHQRLTFESGRINRCHYSVVEKINNSFYLIQHDIALENSKKGLY